MRKKLFPWINQDLFIRLLAAITVWLLTFYVMPFYTNGDQTHYRRVYENLSGLNLRSGYLYYSQALSSFEYIHFYLSWIASRIMEKDLFIAFNNAIFAYIVMLLFQRWNVSTFIAIWIITFNFYFIVLYFAAERLKFGFMFLALSIIYSDYAKRFYTFAILAVVSHVQVTLFYASIFFNIVLKFVSNSLKTNNLPRLIVFFSPLLLVPPLIGNQLISKLQSHYGDYGINDLAKLTVFLLLSLIYAQNKNEVIKLFLPVIIAILMVGGERVNLVGYFIFLYYGLKYNKGWNFGVLITSLYFSYTSIGMLNNIFLYGDGFYR